jgi:P-type Mg2+ transporter
MHIESREARSNTNHPTIAFNATIYPLPPPPRYHPRITHMPLQTQTPPPPAVPNTITGFAATDAANAMNELGTTADGLTIGEAERRLAMHGPNAIAKERELSVILKFLSYFASPLVIILLIASLVSAYFGEMRNAVIIWVMVLLSVILDFAEEHGAGKAAKKLQDNVRVTATVIRNGKKVDIRTAEIVPGDVIFVCAGNLVPADARIISADDCFVNQSALTGESLPSEKHDRPLPPDRTALGDLDNILFFGTSVITGCATAVAVATGKDTEFGKIAEKLVQPEEKSEFEQGVASFGYFIMKVILFLTLTIFFANTLLHRHVLESFMFAVAIAVGVTPELLPMIMSITMARGSIRMSKKGVIVKKLSAIPSFGSMNVLCTDKTGTLTEDNIRVAGTIDADGTPSNRVLLYAYLNSTFQTGIANPLDRAIAAVKKPAGAACYEKTEEIPFDFQRKMMSIAVKNEDGHLLITKGAPEEIWARCSSVAMDGGNQPFDAAARGRAEARYADLSAQGFRVLAIAAKRIAEPKEKYTTKDEAGLEFIGFISFLDPPKKGVKAVLKDLRMIGVDVKIITGDNELVTEKLCRDAGLAINGTLLGNEITSMTDDALRVKAARTTVFARFSPDQKNRIIHALRSNGNVVGYMGDGINDAPSLKSADVGITVSNALDVARESADMVLTQKSLKILREGILEGRKTFGNTMKYILMGLSSNFGNMFSMLAAVVFLPFLPMLPVQILLNNLLYDFSQVTLPVDNVDADWLRTPRRWNFSYIKKFMLSFGPVSSIFDVATYAILFFAFSADASTFQTGWFMESLATQSLVIHVIRTKKLPFIESAPSPWLLASTFAIVILGWTIPYTPIGAYFSFTPLPWFIVATITGIVLAYLAAVEIAKRFFFKKHDMTSLRPTPNPSPSTRSARSGQALGREGSIS